MSDRNLNPGTLIPGSARRFWVFVFAVTGTALLPSCTHLEYTHGWRDTVAREYDPYADSTRRYDMDLETHELALLDGTGGVCAAIATSSARSSARMDAEREIIEKGGYSAEYSYKVYSPAEFAGLNCGLYYKWGSGVAEASQINGDAFGQPGTYEIGSAPMKMWEAGLHLGGTERIPKVQWLRTSIDVRLGIGKYTFGEPITDMGSAAGTFTTDQGEFTFHTPVTFGLLAFPRQAFGFGAHVYGGFDPLGWLLTRGTEKAYKKFDYGAKLGYVLPLKYLSLSVWGGWQNRNHLWGDYWVKYGEWTVTGMLRVNLESFKGGGGESRRSRKAGKS